MPSAEDVYMALLRLIPGAFLSCAVYGVLLFAPAWTLHWWRAWTLLGLTFIGMLVMRLWVFPDDGGLLAERRRPPIQRGQPAADKLLTLAFLVVLPSYLMFIPVDVFRLRLLPLPQPALSLIGLLLGAAGMSAIALAFRENTFAVAIVKDQYERGHVIIDSGIYSVVRHPLYLGVALALVGTALWLQSYAGALAAIVPITLLVLRIGVEERFLRSRMPAYAAYASRVRTRLIPGVW